MSESLARLANSVKEFGGTIVLGSEDAGMVKVTFHNVGLAYRWARAWDMLEHTSIAASRMHNPARCLVNLDIFLARWETKYRRG